MRLLLDSNIFVQVVVRDDRHLKRQMRIHKDRIEGAVGIASLDKLPRS